jgi:hypothetical protein
MSKEYVQCVVCGKNYVGKIPSLGDGSILFPRLHFAKLPSVTTNLGIMIAKYPGNRVYCAGSFVAGILKGGE